MSQQLAESFWGNFWEWVARELDELGPEYPEAVVALIDALRDYIRCNERDEAEGLREGWITSEEAARNHPHDERCQALLKELEAGELCPSLNGTIKEGR